MEASEADVQGEVGLVSRAGAGDQPWGIKSQDLRGSSILWMKGIPTLVWVRRRWESTEMCTGKV